MAPNNWTRTTAPRRPAVPLEPVADPAGWSAAEDANTEEWIYHLSDGEIAELLDAVGRVESRGLDIMDVARDDFPLPTLAPALAEIRVELLDGRGYVMVRGLPIAEMTPAQAGAALWGIGLYLGRAVSQNADGHLLGHVKDLGGDYADPLTRGYQTKAAMGFHADPCDFVALLCLRPAESGGASRIVSSITLYNEMLKRRPDLVKELLWTFYWSRIGEIAPGKDPWYRMSVFSFQDGYLSVRGVSNTIFKSQTIPGVPKFTAAQVEAFELFRTLADELSMDMDFRHGDIQFLMNHVTLHTRRPYEDSDDFDRKRHLFRLWLITDGARPLPPEFVDQLEGVQVAGTVLKAPLDAI